jgi:hypothetical protein
VYRSKIHVLLLYNVVKDAQFVGLVEVGFFVEAKEQ